MRNTGSERKIVERRPATLGVYGLVIDDCLSIRIDDDEICPIALAKITSMADVEELCRRVRGFLDYFFDAYDPVFDVFYQREQSVLHEG